MLVFKYKIYIKENVICIELSLQTEIKLLSSDSDRISYGVKYISYYV